MVGRSSAIREFSSVTGLNYKQLVSAQGQILSDDVLNDCYNYAKKRVKYPVDVVSKPLTVKGLRQQIDMYMEMHKGKKTIITLDHTLLVQRLPTQSTNDMLFELGEFLTQTKRDYPCSFIVLSQLNRAVEHPDRAVNGKYGNYINEQDIFGADAMLQHADILVGVNRPANRKIKYYGPDRYIIEDDSVLVFHFLKARTGDRRMSFFKAKFAEMKIEEMNAPMTKTI